MKLPTGAKLGNRLRTQPMRNDFKDVENRKKEIFEIVKNGKK